MAGNAFHDQKQSTFFSNLPLELRTMIYRFTLLPNIAVHLCCQRRDPLGDEEKQNNKLVCVPCVTNHDFSLPVKDVWDQPDLDWGLEHQLCFQKFKRRYKGRLNMNPLISSLRRPKRLPTIQLMLTCHRMLVNPSMNKIIETKFVKV
jgi:2EXR family